MAIRFSDKKPDAAEGEKKATIEARFATPIEAEDPVNDDAASELPFGKPPAVDKKGRKRK